MSAATGGDAYPLELENDCGELDLCDNASQAELHALQAELQVRTPRTGSANCRWACHALPRVQALSLLAHPPLCLAACSSPLLTG